MAVYVGVKGTSGNLFTIGKTSKGQIDVSSATPSGIGTAGNGVTLTSTVAAIAIYIFSSSQTGLTSPLYLETGNSTVSGVSGGILSQTGTTTIGASGGYSFKSGNALGGASGSFTALTGTSDTGLTGSYSFTTGPKTGTQTVSTGSFGVTTGSNSSSDGASGTGSIDFTTGSRTISATGFSGDINFTTGTTIGGTRGLINFNSTSVQSSANIFPAVTNTSDLGSSSRNWRIVYTRLILCDTGTLGIGSNFNSAGAIVVQSGHSSTAANTGAATYQSGDQLTTGTGTCGTATFRSGAISTLTNANPSGTAILQSGVNQGLGASGTVTITSGLLNNVANTSNSGNVTVTTGTLNATSGTPSTGSLTLSTGTPTGTNNSTGDINIAPGTPTGTGTRGSVLINALTTQIQSGKLKLETTTTAPGTTGAQTINKMSGTVNFAATTTTLVVTNNKVTANSLVFAVLRTASTTAQVLSVVPAAGSFTITIVADAALELSVGFMVIND